MKTTLRQNFFSIIEFLTVVFIILLLMSLLTPMFANLKMKARTSVCKNQLRQLGSLITSYQTDHNGHLSFSSASDIPLPNTGNNSFYTFWNGHLLPYMDFNLSDRYYRYAMVTKVGTTRYLASQLGGPRNGAPQNVLAKGWVVVDDAYTKGGYQDLRSFICPEIHQNTFDVSASIKYNGIKIPRISQLCNSGFQDAAGFDYGMSGGVPTTYIANQVLFGFGATNSMRMDQITQVSEKAFLLEGGVADIFGPGSNGALAPPYFMENTYSPYIGGALIARFAKSDVGVHKLSFVHDNYETFWVMSSKWWTYYFPSYLGDEGWKAYIANKFNIQFAGKASMVLGSSTWSYDTSIGYDIVSYVNPYLNSVTIDGGTIFDNFFKANPTHVPLKSFEAFVDEPNDYKYLVGDMKVLFGDGSVQKKDAAWLCNNRLKMTSNSN